MNVIFYRESGARVEIGSLAFEKMRSERQLNDLAAEAGGVLLGRYIVGCEDIVIDDVTTPFGEDERGRFFFRRSQAPHQAAINERWTASDGRCHYLGEWHTHPESDPHASRTDVGDWKRRLKADIFDADSLLFIIVGTDVVRLWEGRRTRSVLWNCSIINPLRFDREGPR